MRKLVALLTAVSLLTPLAAARGATSCGETAGSWTVLAGPRFPTGPQTITDFAVEARAPSRMYVTNGASVMRSTDGGCSWQQSYVVGEESFEAYTASNARIVSLVVPESGGRVLLTIAETLINQTRPHVVVSFTAGRSWETGDAGLPPLGSPEMLVVAPSSPDTAYLAVDLGGGLPIDSFWASTDGGRSWQARDQHPGGEFTGFEVDPIVPNELWAYGNGLHRSTDGGATWTPIQEFVGTATGPVDVFHMKGRPSSLFVFIPELRMVQRSVDGGETWLQSYGLSDPDSIDHGVAEHSRVATSNGDAYIWAPSLFQWVDARAPRGGVTDVTASRAGAAAFYMRTSTSILVFGGATGTGVDIDVRDFDIGDISLIDPPRLLDPDPPRLSPKNDVVRIPAGETKRVRYDLSLSKVRTPLDLYFLIDTSESAKPFLKGLALVLQDLVNKLYAARLDVQFGLAEYRAYPDSTPPRPQCDDDVPVVVNPQCERNFIYRQRLDISPSSAALGLAIENLEPIAGGHYNAQLPALQQVATGSGIDDWPYTDTEPNYSSHVDGHDVPPGQDASFREKALKIVLISTDEEFSTGAGYPDDDFPPNVPSFAGVIADLNARDIHQVGLALGPAAVGDLRRVATGTGALAPSEGADCDGNGIADVPSGAPLVCMAQQGNLEQGSNLVPAIVNMVEAIRDREPVELDVSAKEPIVDEVTPDEYPGTALQVDQDLKFDVTYRCPTSLAGEKTKVDLSAHQSGGVLARASATVICGRRPKDEPFFDLFPFQQVLGLIPLLPLTAPPTLANPGQATQAQSQAQAQGAMAAQEQEQPQVAFATQYKSALREALAKEDEWQMTRYRDRTEPVLPGVLFGGSALAMAAAYAVAASRRRRVAVARARRRA